MLSASAYACFLASRAALLCVALSLYMASLGYPHNEHVTVAELGHLRRHQSFGVEFPPGLDQRWLCARPPGVEGSLVVGAGGRGGTVVGGRAGLKERASDVLYDGSGASMLRSISSNLNGRAVAEFFDAWACSWDGKHYIWLAEHGYTPNLTATVVLAEPGTLGLVLEVGPLRLPPHLPASPPTRIVRVTQFANYEVGVPLQGEKSGLIGLGDEVYAINGVKTRNVTGLDDILPLFATEERVLTMKPSQERWFDGRAAFLPLFPLFVVRPALWLARVTAWPLANVIPTDDDDEPTWSHAVLLLVCAALSALGGALSQATRARLFKSRGDERPLLYWSDGLLLALPGAFFLCTPYSEVLYFPLASAWLLALQSDRIFLAALLGVALPLARGVGAFTAVPALVFALERAPGLVRPLLWPAQHAAQDGALLKLAGLAALVLAPCAGFGLHNLLMLHEFGTVHAAARAQALFVAKFKAGNMLRPALLLTTLFATTTGEQDDASGSDGSEGYAWHDPTNSLLDRGTFVLAVALLAITASRLPRHVWMYCFVTLMVPPLCGSLMSYSRFFVTSAFPLLWPIADSADPDSNRKLVVSSHFLAAAAAAGFATQASLMWRFLQMEWGG